MKRPLTIVLIVVALVLAVIFGLMVRASTVPPKPDGLSPRAIYVEQLHVPFQLTRNADWLDCWFDEHENVDRCKMTDLRGRTEFEDVFLPLPGRKPAPSDRLQFDTHLTGSVLTSANTNGRWVFVPIVFLQDGTVLIPQSRYDQGVRVLHDFKMD